MTQSAFVLSTTRKYVTVQVGDQAPLIVTKNRTCPDLCPGDEVLISGATPDISVEHLCPRRTIFQRALGPREKLLAANLAHIYLITAPAPLFNPQALDRVITAAAAAGIPCSLVLNKTDLPGTDETLKLINSSYLSVASSIVCVSATTEEGLKPLKTAVQTMNGSTPTFIAFTGLSGVGKSTIIGALSGSELARQGELSERSGMGRQTTSQAYAYHISHTNLFLVDLPGIQNFGLTHLGIEQITAGFPEIAQAIAQCRFSDCKHDSEEYCGVRDALSAGKITNQRYQSYQAIIGEITIFSNRDH
ncbi:MAG: ribosome small subunit-dependent GTPase A [bacterium]|nr:ribosome small subunit-dependent GTPase A [bacterium]